MQRQNGDEEAFRALSLRPASAADEPFLLKLFAATRSDELALTNWDENQKQAFIAMQFKAQSRHYDMNYPDAQNSIILWNDDPVGRLLLDRGELQLTLVDIALLPAHRNSGIGTGLIQDIVKEARAAAKPIRLHVFCSSAAKRLYERLGFSQIGEDGAYLEMMWVPPVS
jgi:ribosomal protein S18 acetylase RimI-like enzyme